MVERLVTIRSLLRITASRSVTDLVLQAYQLLRQDLQELINEMEEVEP